MNNYVIGVDIGGTNYRMALVDSYGAASCLIKASSEICLGREHFCSRLMSDVDTLMRSAIRRQGVVSGIGIGVPGLVDRNGMICSSVNMRPLDGFNLANYIHEKSGVRAVCANDANVIAEGELLFGAGRKKSSFVVITIGTGLGSGLVLNGKIWTGTGGFAAELGHVTVCHEGLLCTCGNYGCLEQYVSAGALIREFTARSPDSSTYSLSASDIARLARAGNDHAMHSFKLMGSWLGTALASLLSTLNLEAIIITGGVADSLDLFENAIREAINRHSFPLIASCCMLLKGELGDNAGLLGGAALVLRANSQTFSRE